METNRVPQVEPLAERLTWAEICARFPNEWVVLTEADWANDTDFDFGTATVLGHFKTRKEASPHVKRAFERYSEVGSFWTGRIRAGSLRLATL